MRSVLTCRGSGNLRRDKVSIKSYRRLSKYLHVVPLKSKKGPSVTSAFESVLKDARYSKPIRRWPVWVQTDRGKVFVNRPFQDTLKHPVPRVQAPRREMRGR